MTRWHRNIATVTSCLAVASMLAACSPAARPGATESGPSQPSTTATSTGPTAPPSPSPSSSSTSPDPGTTGGYLPSGSVAITIQINECDGCVITAYNTALHGYDVQQWAATVSGTTARLRVPTAETHLMSFDVVRPDGIGGGGAVPVIALRYEGQQPGAEVTDEQAIAAVRGSMCWLGTDRPAFTMGVRTHFSQSTDYSGDPITVVSFWASPSLPTPDQWSPVSQGGMGHQDVPWCGQ